MAEAREGLLAFQDALRALEAEAVAARKAKGRPHSRREAAREARGSHVRLDDRRIGEWLRRDGGRAPRDADQVWALVQVWCRWAGRSPRPGDRRYWNGLVAAARPPRADRPDTVGRPLGDWPDPLDLELHPAIDSPHARLPGLPAYVERGHDTVLEQVVEDALRHSTMAVLVGEAATGKTRACWESLRLLPDEWNLWHPLAPSRPQATLKEIRSVGPRTVVWLNELQHYLLTPGVDLGEQVAAELRVLLRDRSRGPVLVLGTIWPRHWATLTGYNSLHEDPHAQARALLTGTEIPVPTTFSPRDIDRALVVAETDPRLAEAVRNAEDGHLTQYLAGGPALQALYRTASPAARALMDAAIDARRLGHGPYLPRSLLLAAVPGYLTRPQWEMLPDGWQDEAFGYVTDHRPCRGARAPLTPLRPGPGENGDAPCFRLADHLEQSGQSARLTFAAPEALWEALLAHARGPDLIRLGRQAQSRGLYRYALRFYSAAFHADPGATDAMDWAGDLHRTARRYDEALRCHRLAAANGDAFAWTKAAGILCESGRLDEAVKEYEDAAAAGVADALVQAADMLAEHGRHGQAMALLRRAAGSGVTEASARLGALPHGGGDDHVGEAIEHLRIAAEAGDAISLDRVVTLMRDAGGVEATIGWLRDRRPGGEARATTMIAEVRWRAGDHQEAIDVLLPLCAENVTAARTAAGLLASLGRGSEAIVLYRQAAEMGDVRSLREAALLLDSASRTGEAIEWLLSRAGGGDAAALDQAMRISSQARRTEVIDWLRERARTGDADAVRRLAQFLHEAGRLSEAIQAYRDFEGDIGAAGLRHQADLLREAGRADEAVACYRSAAENGAPEALGQAAVLLRDAGRTDEAVEWLRSRVAAGDGEAALRWTIDLLLEAGRTGEAIDWLRGRVEEGDLDALTWAANLLRDTGRADEALAYYLRAAEAGKAGLDPDDDSGALALAAALLRDMGRHEDADRVVEHGIEPGGRLAESAPAEDRAAPDVMLRTADVARG
ncbi:MAG TPA: tetratricopeptide repeat protein [Spirillospora sp.]|nr:tetratricopeptide repeat protein [Spirillospora sp.]